MTRATRTLNPLPFHDLEPHRFEDLVRGVLYGFKYWLKLEPTGRGGSDDGFDVRGWEVAPSTNEPNEDAEQPSEVVDEGRLWLVQCKREKTITPAKLTGYLNTIPSEQRTELDGVIFAAACDFSKASHDAFRKWCRDAGIQEFHLWGKAQLEDFLYLPKNDRLLFAFFGISLTVRQRSQRTELRSILTTKKKIIKIAGGIGRHVFKTCLFRDPTDKRYPWPPKGLKLKSPGQTYNYHWFSRAIEEVRHDGVLITWRDCAAYVSDDGTEYDIIEILDHAVPSHHESPWSHYDDEKTLKQKYYARAFWNDLPVGNRATIKVWGFIPYENILAIDDDGDGTTQLPTIFVTFDAKAGPFSWYSGSVETDDERENLNPKTIIDFFPSVFPDPPDNNEVSDAQIMPD
jgi:hypothetical protein